MKNIVTILTIAFVGSVCAIGCESTYDSGNKNYHKNAAVKTTKKTDKKVQKKNASNKSNDWNVIL